MKKILFTSILFLIMLSSVSCKPIDITIETLESDDTSVFKEQSVETTKYTVSFNSNGGTNVESQTISELSSAPTTIRNGYIFNGWFLDQQLTQKVTYPLKLNKDITLYAKWIKKTYMVHFETNGGTNVATQNVSSLYSEPITQKEGCLFQGWYMDSQLTTAAIFPLEVTKSMTLYAKWLTIKQTKTLSDSKIKDWSPYSNEVTYSVTPNGFEMDKLESLGYKMKITVDYNVRYVKDYDAILNIGYVGAPRYEVYLLDSDGSGSQKEDVKTQTYSEKKTMLYSATVADIKKDKITLTFSTNNKQNIIYFEDIKVTYECYK